MERKDKTDESHKLKQNIAEYGGCYVIRNYLSKDKIYIIQRLTVPMSEILKSVNDSLDKENMKNFKNIGRIFKSLLFLLARLHR
jgi:hypothetical protein